MAVAAAIPYVLAAVSTAVTVVAAVQQGKAAQRAADFNAKVAQDNAMLARQQAQSKARQQDRVNRLRLGAIRAAHGASGGAAGEGSVLDVLGDTAMQGELEKQNILYAGRVQAAGYRNEASLSTAEGKSARAASTLKAGSALLSGASQGYDIYQRM